ncbi:MAG TPA: DUF2339 domain-containing protein [Reyranella sp.]|nr:DUF2339 domain-containing protein [Reyranella sp.]
MDEIVLILLGIAWAIGTPLIAIIALVRASSQRTEIAQLKSDLAALRRQMAENTSIAALPPPFEAPVAEIPPPFEPEPPVLPAPVAEPQQAGWEQRLGGRAFLWIGAITLALAAIFLVRYSIEEGWLSPEVRVILAAAFGFVLIGVAESMRGRDERVAQALAAAGVAALYGALFAAVALYEMISKVAAGGGAAALTAFAIGVSLRHGLLVAALAFVGGFVSPAIIGSETPNTPVLFGYLLAIAAGTLAVIRARGWWPLGWGVLGGSALWTIAWMMSIAGGLHWVGLFLVAVAGLFVWAVTASDEPSPDVAALVWAALVLTGVLLVAIIVQDEGRQIAGWLALALHGAGLFALARRAPRFQDVAVVAPALSTAALLLWWTASREAGAGWEADRFAWIAALLGGFYAAGAFALLWNAGRPGFWAALSVAAALSHFLAGWYVLRATAPGTPWGLISIGLAVPFLIGAERLARWRGTMTGATEALGFLAAGVAFFIAIAIALELRREWITVAYAVEFAAVSVIAARLDLVAMRRLCWPLLAIVVVRFVLNPEVLNYPLGLTPIFNWILWGYGLSIAALLVGLRFLRPTGEERLVRATEAAIALLAFVLATLQVRSAFQHDSMTALDAGFMERSFYVLVWGAFALAALWLARVRHDPVALWAWRASGTLALATVFVVQVLIANPIVIKADIGRLPVANGLLLAYAMPAAMAALARRWIDVEQNKIVALVAEAAASVLAFVYVSLEVRHVFDPGLERAGFGASGLELYAYSIVWLLFGVGLLALGFMRGTPPLRHAGMALVCVVVAKVFLIDMAGLQGLLRVLSFLGLGAALVGLGYAYRRFAVTR